MADNRIEIALSKELYEITRGTKVIVCRAFGCKMHEHGDIHCRLKEVSVNEDGKCAYFQVKD